MRRFLLALCFLATSAVSAQAQNGCSTREGCSTNFENFWSVRAGVSFSTLYNDFQSSRYQTGYNAAALYNISLSSDCPIYLQTGVGMVMKGARNSRLLADQPKAQFKSYEATIPVSLNYAIAVGDEAAIVPEVGVYYTYAIDGSLGANGNFYRPYKKQEIMIDEVGMVNSRIISRSDFGMRLGLSYAFNRYSMGFAYEVGLLNRFASDLQDMGYMGSSGSWSINLGYRFR